MVFPKSGTSVFIQNSSAAVPQCRTSGMPEARYETSEMTETAETTEIIVLKTTQHGMRIRVSYMLE